MCWVIAILLKFKFKCSDTRETKWREVISMYDIFASDKQENLCSTLDIKAVGVFDFN